MAVIFGRWACSLAGCAGAGASRSPRGPIVAIVIAWTFASAGGVSAAATLRPFAEALEARQVAMVGAVNRVDPSARWQVEEHARGCARVISGGSVWEKGCVSVTVVEDGVLTAQRAEAITARTGVPGVAEGVQFSAAALSFVLHARSPLVPTLRGDARCFAVGGREWYGGGLDLTPSYHFDEDATHFHRGLLDLCETHGGGGASYRVMKRACDDYFYLPARREHRGVGGVFFDDLEETWAPDFCLALLDAALEPDGPYLPVVQRHRDTPFTEEERHWQLLRRGRYVEFNLLYDRGVRFGLSPESVERVLVSSPPLVAWDFHAEPQGGSREAATMKVLRSPRSWVD